MRKLLWRLKHKCSKMDARIQLEYDKKQLFLFIMDFDEGKLRQALVEMLRKYDYSYRMDFGDFQNFIFWLHESEKKTIVEARTKETNV